jgi:hypothetical protein
MVTGGLSGREYANYYYQSIVNNNSVDVASTNIDLFKSLPSTKCDFLSSFSRRLIFQSLNTSPNDDNLFWLTPSDIETSGLEYSKATLDYTPFVDISSYKRVCLVITTIIILNTQSKYKSN